MSGRGKGGKGLGKGGVKRHRKVLRDNIQGITKPAIRRLCRRGGVKRISGLTYEETRGVLKIFLENVIRDSVTYTEHARRKTVTARDVVFALKKQGRTLYGFGSDTMFFQSIRPKARKAPSATTGPLPPPPPPPPPPPGPSTGGGATQARRSTRNTGQSTAPSAGGKKAPSVRNEQAGLSDELHVMCDELDSCCNVGLFLDEIITYFKDFINFRYVTDIVEVYEDDLVRFVLNNKKHNDEVTTILNVNNNQQDFNLVYDYFMQYMFHEIDYTPQYPNTNKALNLYKFKSDLDYNQWASDFDQVIVQNIKQHLVYMDMSDMPRLIKDSSNENFMFCFDHISTRFFDEINTVFTGGPESDDFWKHDAATTFFQLYSFLRSHKKLFTHYNLSKKNILLTYTPSKYYNFIYKENGAVIIEFKSK